MALRPVLSEGPSYPLGSHWVRGVAGLEPATECVVRVPFPLASLLMAQPCKQRVELYQPDAKQSGY